MSFAEYARRTLPQILMPKMERPQPVREEGRFLTGDRLLWWGDSLRSNPELCTFVDYITDTHPSWIDMGRDEALVIMDDSLAGEECFVFVDTLTFPDQPRPITGHEY